MSELAKLKARLKSLPKDFSYNEAKTLLKKLGFKESNKGKTSGSRVQFQRNTDGATIYCHKPPPSNILKPSLVKELLQLLKESGDIED